MPRDTVLTLLQKSARFLEEKGVSEPRPSAEILLCHALLCKRIDLYLRFDQPLREAELETFRGYIRRRLTGEPVQYITGETEFYGLPFKVDPSVLIPRPETEHLVEVGIAECSSASWEGRVIHALDIGTGSGAIAIALAKHVPALQCLAIDISPAALAIAAVNASANGVQDRIRFLEWDILSQNTLPAEMRFHLIVSNPPYIAQDELPALQVEVRDFEPRVATTDGADGLSFYRRIADLASALLEPDGCLMVEIGYAQSADVTGIFRPVFDDLTFVKDYSSIDRVLIAKKLRQA